MIKFRISMLLIFILMSCGIKHNLSDNWVAGKPCQAPCWESITPGVTTKADAENVLSNLSYIKSVENQENTPGNGGFVWFGTISELAGMVMYQENKVILIELRSLEKVSFRDVMQTYGDPTSVFAQGGASFGPPITYSAGLLYKNHGFMIGTNSIARFPIDQTLELRNRVTFFEPSDQGMKLLASRYSISWVPWEGFGTFSFYCERTGIADSKICHD